MIYLNEVQRGMNLLAKDERTLFVGQAMCYPGHAVTHQVKDFPQEKLIELPVMEDFQAGFCLGLALEGYIPVCIYPRCNFAILACNQIINHIDKWSLMNPGAKKIPKVIIKMVVGSKKPLDPGWQHKANFTDGFRAMCENIEVCELTQAEQVYNIYDYALNKAKESTIIVEHGDLY